MIQPGQLRTMTVMSRPSENPITFHSLHASPLVSVRDYCCHISCGGPGEEEQPDANQIALMRHGAFSKHFGKRSLTADVNQAIFFSKESTYRISHPTDRGDRGTLFIPSPRILNDIIRELDPTVDEHPERPFPFVIGPCDSEIFWRHRELVKKLEAADAEPLEPLWADVTALQLIADVLEAAYVRHDLPRKPRRNGTESDHADRAEAAKTYLASRISEAVSLDDVARAVFTSPFHFARIFQKHTGVPVHRYLTQLRLRASLERLADGAEDLTALALELGFSSHSHFTDTFRKEFGVTPSEVRINASQRSLREMSKNLEV
ncbi:MAG: helix-turn-helix domain-containing protein [Blastocatellia bacterium]